MKDACNTYFLLNAQSMLTINDISYTLFISLTWRHQDIRLALHPTFTRDEVGKLDDNHELARDLFGRRYLPGFVGLNNLNCTDYLNAVVQALGHVRPLRDFFLLAANSNEMVGSNNQNENGGQRQTLPHSEFSPLAKSFSLLLRNMWSPHRFKSNVDPHMLVQAVSVASNKRYHVGKQAEAGEFLAWLLHQLHLGVGGSNSAAGGKRKKRGKRVSDESSEENVGRYSESDGDSYSIAERRYGITSSYTSYDR